MRGVLRGGHGDADGQRQSVFAGAVEVGGDRHGLREDHLYLGLGHGVRVPEEILLVARALRPTVFIDKRCQRGCVRGY